MKRLVLLLSVIMVTGVLFTAAATPSPKPAAAGPVCTETGDGGSNVIAGGKGTDVLCGLGGKDFLFGNGGRDRLRGGFGPDALTGALGRDVVKGNGGNDRIFIVDGKGGELADGGAGFDRCYVDGGDRVRGCDRVFVSYSQNLTSALEDTAFRVATVAEAATSPSPTPSPAPSPPPVVTVTVTVTAPPVSINGGCTAGPPQPPPFCSPTP